MALPTAYLDRVETYNCEEGDCAYNLHFRMDPMDPNVNASVFRGGEYVESGDLECDGEGNCSIDSTSAEGVQVSVRVVLYTGSGSTLKESFSNAIVFTPGMPAPPGGLRIE
jgi:hypothetical protein